MSRPADRCRLCRGTGVEHPALAHWSTAAELLCVLCAGRKVRLHPRRGDVVRFIFWWAKPRRYRPGQWEVVEDAADLGATVRLRSSSSGIVRDYAAARFAVVETAEERVAAAGFQGFVRRGAKFVWEGGA